MLKRTISIGLVLIMAFAMAAPILHIDCDMPCCEVEKMTCCDKGMDKEMSKACKMDMKSCDMGSTFVPILSAPFHQPKLKMGTKVERVFQPFSSIPTFKSNYNSVLLVYPPDPPTAFNRPLLA
jgi:hypothetical protein|tara:strand:- start:114 stop:482 length:369 start_codon:yes stop_codon:yes gene_type:complete